MEEKREVRVHLGRDTFTHVRDGRLETHREEKRGQRSLRVLISAAASERLLAGGTREENYTLRG